jgi:transposase
MLARLSVAFNRKLLGNSDLVSNTAILQCDATRYDRLAANYLAFVQLASIRLWPRANESAS